MKFFILIGIILIFTVLLNIDHNLVELYNLIQTMP